ncbi:MAG: DUF2974 domain-containing protein [Clostridia bacterium]|nr:DUF2974 domain-containing protein [Clostridia bacterium]
MGTVYDYLDWRGDLTFREVPPNEVDCLLFSVISYMDFQEIVPDAHTNGSISLMAAANGFLARNPDPKKHAMGVLIPREIIKVFSKMKNTKRFRNVEMKAFVNLIDTEHEIQFSAVTFLLGNGSAVVTYRGTDDILVGWKEDMNMCFLPVVPAQEKAVEYLREASDAYDGRLILTGHSKGGNLAVFAAVHSERAIRERITDVFSNDAPGFGQSILEDPVYLEMRPLIRSFVPQSSIVGMLLEHDENYTVVKSRQKTGLLQHNGLSWEILGGGFVRLKEISNESKNTDRTVNQWIRDMTPAQREEFAEAVYQLFSVDGVTTLTDLVGVRKKWLAHSKSLDPKVHETIQKMLSSLIALNAKNVFGGIFRTRSNKTPPPTAEEK